MAQQDNVKPAPPQASPPADAGQAAAVVVDVRRKRKKKYSRGLKEAQKVEQCAARGAARLAKAVADGFSEYRARSGKSARRKRDGAVRDAVRNVGRGLEAALETAARVPADLTRRVSVRRLARLVVPPPFNWFVR